MIRSIELNKEDMDEIMENLPPHIQKKLAEIIKPDSGISIVQQFVENYEDDNVMDHILSHTISNLIRKISSAANQMAKENKTKVGKRGLTTMELGIITIECLRHEANTIESAFSDHDKTCTKGDKCGAKH